MTSNRFFVRKQDIRFPLVLLTGGEHHHLGKVLRAVPGDEIQLFDEDGRSYGAMVEKIEKNQTWLRIENVTEEERPGLRITVAQALLKSQAMEFVIQKATELGAAAVIPLIAARSVARLEGRADRKLERWRKIVREAAKQCKITFPPEILPPLTLDRLAEERTDELKLLLSENKGRMLKDILLGHISPTGSAEGMFLKTSPQTIPTVLLVVGPEGGWAFEEEELLLGRGFQAVSLGKNILRAETAVLAGLALINHFWNS